MSKSQHKGNGKLALLSDFDFAVTSGKPGGNITRRLTGRSYLPNSMVSQQLWQIATSPGAPAIRRLASALVYPLAKAGISAKKEKSPGPTITRAAANFCRNVPRGHMEVGLERLPENGDYMRLLAELQDRAGADVYIFTNSPTTLVEDYITGLGEKYGVEFKGVRGIDLKFRHGRTAGLDTRDVYTNLAATRGSEEAKNYFAAKLEADGYRIIGSAGDSKHDLINPSSVDEALAAHFPGVEVERRNGGYRNLYLPPGGRWRVCSNGCTGGEVVDPGDAGRIVDLLLDGTYQRVE